MTKLNPNLASKVNPDLGTEIFKDPMVLVCAQLLYPFYGIQVTLVDTEDHGFTSLPVDRTATFVLMINSKHDNQRLEARKELKSLLQSLNIKTPDLTNQPPQVEAATYVRLLQQHSWYGWLFTKKTGKLDLLKVDAERGVSKRHHKEFINHSFSPLNKQIDRDDAIKRGFEPESSWWYLKSLHPNPIQDFPNDLLLWKNADGEDRGDVTDINLLADSLGITDKELSLTLFYQIKFEMADVICFDRLYGKSTTNLPGNIFSRNPKLKASLTGELISHYRLHGFRPTVDQIYQAGSEDKIPNHSWNGKWMSD